MAQTKPKHSIMCPTCNGTGMVMKKTKLVIVDINGKSGKELQRPSRCLACDGSGILEVVK